MSRQHIEIDRLAIEIPGVSAGRGRDLAVAVAAALAAAGGMPGAGDIPNLRGANLRVGNLRSGNLQVANLRVEIVDDPRLDPPELARRIVAATLDALRRST
jgi:hypothetical protein